MTVGGHGAHAHLVTGDPGVVQPPDCPARPAEQFFCPAPQVRLGGVQIYRGVGCFEMHQPADGHPIVGWLPGTTSLYVAVTHSGVTLAAHLAQLITTELLSGSPAAELAPYRPGRFAAAAPPAGYRERKGTLP